VKRPVVYRGHATTLGAFLRQESAGQRVSGIGFSV
jgi:hypothetical protein